MIPDFRIIIPIVVAGGVIIIFGIIDRILIIGMTIMVYTADKDFSIVLGLIVFIVYGNSWYFLYYYVWLKVEICFCNFCICFCTLAYF